MEVDRGWFRTLGVEPLHGRGFTPDDTRQSEPVILVTEAMARALAPDGDPASAVGMRIRSWRDEDVYRRIVGVMPRPAFGARPGAIDEEVVFVPITQSTRSLMAFLLRVNGEPTGLAPGVRTALAELDPEVVVADMPSLRSGDEIRRLVLREGLVLALAGLGLGTGLGLLFARGLSSSLTGVGWLDPATWLGAAGALLAATLLATAVPAWRATRVDPARTLNAE